MKTIILILLSLVCYSSQQFVTRNGNKFNLNGKPFYFQGNNLYYISLTDGYTTEQDVVDLLRETAAKGIKVVRFWGFSNGDWYSMPTMQPKLGQFNEVALKKLDFAIKKTAEFGMKAIIPFVNNWKDYNGMQWYVDQTLGGGKPKEEFYKNSYVKDKYKAWVKYLLYRKNTYSGVLYKDDPTVFSWELANEPSTSDKYDTTGNTIYNWLKEMSEFVYSLDQNHMISTGEEGYGVGGNEWTDDGTKGLDFDRNTGLPRISYGSIHIYPDKRHWNRDLNWVDAWLTKRKNICNKYNKPCVLVEYGRSQAYDYDRDAVFKRWHDLGNKLDMNGMMVWQMEKSPRDANTNNEKFCFTFWDSAAKLISDNASFMNNKSK